MSKKYFPVSHEEQYDELRVSEFPVDDAASSIWERLQEFVSCEGGHKALLAFRDVDVDQIGWVDLDQFGRFLEMINVVGVSPAVTRAVMQVANSGSGDELEYGVFLREQLGTAPGALVAGGGPSGVITDDEPDTPTDVKRRSDLLAKLRIKMDSGKASEEQETQYRSLLKEERRHRCDIPPLLPLLPPHTPPL